MMISKRIVKVVYVFPWEVFPLRYCPGETIAMQEPR